MFCTCVAAAMRPIATSTPKAPKKPMEKGEWFSSFVSFCTTTGGTGETGSSGMGAKSCSAPLRALPNKPPRNCRNLPRVARPPNEEDFFLRPEFSTGTVDSVAGFSGWAVGETDSSGAFPNSSEAGGSSAASGTGVVTSPACVPAAAGPSPRHR